MSTPYLDDRAAIQDVMLRYVLAVDKQDVNALCALFTEDAMISGFTQTPLRGAHEMGACVSAALQPFYATQHLISLPLVEVSSDTAHAQTPVQAIHFFKDRTRGNFTLWGTYETDLVRGGAGWKIRNHNLVTLANNTPLAVHERWGQATR